MCDSDTSLAMDARYARDRDAAESVSVLEAAIQQVTADARRRQGAAAAGPPPFLAAARFDGAKPGYYYSAGDQGVG